ncbi:cholesterol 7-desaturase [Hyposmocoma kahamanoa]|uniref:cholesterol 7-desaturase n=1 Tax=Hyposmocoma kahamanoa TaxID=1477025 RepID=UPI000E6DA107|nr:cholesterol 7-desaturase [Hyposmocoma kahamanoa]
MVFRRLFPLPHILLTVDEMRFVDREHQNHQYAPPQNGGSHNSILKVLLYLTFRALKDFCVQCLAVSLKKSYFLLIRTPCNSVELLTHEATRLHHSLVPKGVSVKKWPTVEVEGAVWIWHDAENRPPMWEMKEPEELKTYGYRGRNEFTVSCHIQEIPENGADVAHLNAVHGTSVLATFTKKHPILHSLIGEHYWTADWQRNQDRLHTTDINITHDYKWMKINLFHVDVKVTQIGPGQVQLRLSTSLGKALISNSVTPVGPLKQKCVFRVFSPASNAMMGWIFNRSEAAMFKRDVAIWNSKRYVGAPAYVKADKTIRAYRTWFSQFYSDNSQSFREANQNPLDW